MIWIKRKKPFFLTWTLLYTCQFYYFCPFQPKFPFIYIHSSKGAASLHSSPMQLWGMCANKSCTYVNRANNLRFYPYEGQDFGHCPLLAQLHAEQPEYRQECSHHGKSCIRHSISTGAAATSHVVVYDIKLYCHVQTWSLYNIMARMMNFVPGDLGSNLDWNT